MGLFSKIKKGMGLGTISFELIVPSSITGTSGRLEGSIVVTAKSDQKVKDVEATFQRVVSWQERETFYDSSSGRNEDRWIDKSETLELGKFVDANAFALAADESKTIPFVITFAPVAPQPGQDSGGWGILDSLTDLTIGSSHFFGPTQRNQRVKYQVTGDADLEDVAFDKGDSKDVVVL